MFDETTTVAAHDVDTPLSYDWYGRAGRCRLRVWRSERLAVVTELRDDNPGPSVTNAAEAVAGAVEALLGCTFGVDGDGWLLAEHYHGGLVHGPTVDFVSFAGRRDGRLVEPTWTPLQRGEMGWLWDALEASTCGHEVDS